MNSGRRLRQNSADSSKELSQNSVNIGKVVALERSVVDIHGDIVGVNARLDGFGWYLERIERRLELSDENP